MSRPSRVRDKWREKRWYTMVAPSAFGNVEIGGTPAANPKYLVGRKVETTLYAISGDFNQIHVKLYFQVNEVKGEKAYTHFAGHDFTRDYLRSLVRRGSSRIDGIFNVTTKDGYMIRIYAIAFPVRRAKTTQQSAIREIMEKVINRRAKRLNFDAFIQECVLGKMGSDIYNKAKAIFPLRKSEIRKSKLLAQPTA
ncbi:MAG: 30S ribosomal protein S3ae [Candidatus Odinarchaeota archaeon]